MKDLKNDRFLRALARQPVDKTPVWMMRQAGRYLPEYRQVRGQAGDFMSLCKNTELACEVTLQPLERFELDAAILFSDILTIPDAMGLGLYFAEGEGPKFHKPLRSEADIDQLEVINTAADLTYVTDAVSMIRQELNGRVPLIGFSGSPWTLATYMIEGQSSRDYLEFSLSYMAKIVDGLIKQADGRDVPVILFTKGGGLWLEAMADTGCDCLGLDWSVDLGAAHQRVGDKVALQGNMDPAILRAKPEVIRGEVKRILGSFGENDGHVFNLGHGITPDINPDNAKIFIDAVHEFSSSN